MTTPETTIPEAALNREPEHEQEGGGELAEYTEELQPILETAVLVLASADDNEIEHVTDSMVALIGAVDAVSTDGTVALADGVGENADELAEILDAVLELQREGHLEDLFELSKTLSALEADEQSVRGLNRILSAVGTAEQLHNTLGSIVRTLRAYWSQPKND